ncbi:peptidoglycan-binding protein [Streptomyces iakyrus]|uniref:peptidoglycan-binding protein n=1 Tax=Streptomyces iakyrus TaxID=68219 RepID=UPI0036C58E92
MSDSVAKLLALAKAEVGYREGYSGGRYNNKNKFSPAVPGLEWSNYQPWCQTFQSWLFLRAGLAKLAPVTASCAYATSWFKQRGRFSEYPAVGAQVLFGRNGGSHVGIVYAYDETYVYTYEGNTNDSGSAEGNGVYAKRRARRDSYLYGYGYPEFDEGSVSADPDAKRFGYRYAKTGKVVAPAAKYEPFPGAEFFKRNPRSPIVTAMGKRLVAEGCSAYEDGPGPRWTDADRRSYSKWQRKRGYTGSDADGWPGKTTWDALKVPNV